MEIQVQVRNQVFDIFSDRDQPEIQQRLDFIRKLENDQSIPEWVVLAAYDRIEWQCGLPHGFINAGLPGFNERNASLTVQTLRDAVVKMKNK